jgi:hypothetical protein
MTMGAETPTFCDLVGRWFDERSVPISQRYELRKRMKRRRAYDTAIIQHAACASERVLFQLLDKAAQQ